MTDDARSPFALAACRGVEGGCPRAAVSGGQAFLRHCDAGSDGAGVTGDLAEALAARLGDKPLHHLRFSVSVSACPNGCSRPQIADFGLTGAVRPRLSDIPCVNCAACVLACKEGAITLDDDGPVIDVARCLGCGDCLRACPTGTLAAGESGWRVWLGGRLGRHPALAEPLPGLHSSGRAAELLEACLRLRVDGAAGKRFGELLAEAGGAQTLGARCPADVLPDFPQHEI